jgi:hypothetical protein
MSSVISRAGGCAPAIVPIPITAIAIATRVHIAARVPRAALMRPP